MRGPEILEPGDSLGSEDLTGEHHHPVTASVADEPNDDGTWTFWIEWAEGLEWHRDLFTDTQPDTDLTTKLAPEALTSAALGTLAALVQDELADDLTHLHSPITAGYGPNYQHNPDEDAITITAELRLPADVTLEQLAEAAWPFIATCINVTDPGTFGSPYIMSALPEED